MSAYKTVNKRADLKRNFAASLARAVVTREVERVQRDGAGRAGRGRKGSRSMGFGEAGETDYESCAEGWDESGNRGNERNRREKIRARVWAVASRREKERRRKSEKIDESAERELERERSRRIRE